MADRIEARIDIIEIARSGSSVYVWIKNVGTQRIVDIPRSDVFFGPDDNFYHVTYGGVPTPNWTYQLEGGFTEWEQAVTCKITITLASAPAADTYMFKMVIPNGIYDETTFSVN
ncbi:MAG: hypothetical protein PHY28_05650 [Dehalococcoidales bacterium]|nr:hypothetical protein [Dehalococcoidales bacterium]